MRIITIYESAAALIAYVFLHDWEYVSMTKCLSKGDYWVARTAVCTADIDRTMMFAYYGPLPERSQSLAAVFLYT